MKKNFVKMSVCALLAVGVVACGGNKDNTKDTGVTTDTVTNQQEAQIEPLPLTAEELASIQIRIDSLMKAPGRVQLSESSSNLFLIPDSILKNEAIMSDPNFKIQKYWTEEQREKDRILAQIQLENVKLVDGKLKVDISKEDFVKKGLPADYYQFLVQSYNDINFFNELYKSSPEKIKQGWDIMQASYKERLAADYK